MLDDEVLHVQVSDDYDDVVVEVAVVPSYQETQTLCVVEPAEAFVAAALDLHVQL